MKQWLIITLDVWLGWLSCIALAQLQITEVLTGSLSFQNLGIVLIGNLGIFITSLFRGRLDLEMGARDFIASITGPKLVKIPGPKLVKIPLEERSGLTTISDEEYGHASVVILCLSTHICNSSITQFMKYIQNAYNVSSILLPCSRYNRLPYHPLKESVRSASESPSVNVEMRMAHKLCQSINEHKCNCIKYSTVQAVKEKLDPHLNGILIDLSDSCWLLPSMQCLENGCHGCLPKGEVPAVCEALDAEFTTTIRKKPICICIPVNDASDDGWSKVLIRSFKSKDREDRRTAVRASDALQSYLDGRGINAEEEVSYRTLLIILLRLAEISINLLLTLYCQIDGFSSSLLARRVVRDYVVDSKGIGFPASAFLTGALVKVKSSDGKSSVCHVLSFRCTILSVRTLSFIVGDFNLIFSGIWAVLIAFSFNGGVGKWYEIPAMPPSKPRVSVIIAAIGFVIGMDCFEFSKLVTECFEISKIGRENKKSSKEIWVEIRDEIWKEIIKKKKFMVLVVIVLEVFAVVTGARALGLGLNKLIGRWVYCALQVLVWVKWGIGSYLFGLYSPDYDDIRGFGRTQSRSLDGAGSKVYSSAFLLNAVLAGVRGNWGKESADL